MKCLLLSALGWLLPVVVLPISAHPQAAGRIEFREATLKVVEGAGILAVTVQRLDSTAGSASVEVLAVDGTAFNGRDYDCLAGQLTFLNGESEKELLINLHPDAIDEDDEVFSLQLSSPLDAVLGNITTVQITVVDDDPPPTLLIHDAVVVEDNENARPVLFLCELSAPSERVVSAHYATADGTARPGSDYVHTNGILSFSAGTTSAVVTVMLIPDATRELEQDFFLDLSDAVGAALASRTARAAIVELRITQFLRSGADVQLRFPTGTGASFRVERRASLGGGEWSPVPGAENVPGVGKPVTVLDAGATSLPVIFYRVIQLP